MLKSPFARAVFFCCLCLFGFAGEIADAQTTLSDGKLQVFIFAGQSNMVGADSKLEDVDNFPPFTGLSEAQKDVLFSYCIGRENKSKSDGWDVLQPVRGHVGPELSFARAVSENIKNKVAIIKVAAGGTHLGGDWNPDEPSGFELYPLALEWVKKSLAELTAKGIDFELAGFMWHQGENDMFNEDYKKNYGANLKRYLECWRRDLECSELKFFIGELCTKTIWGMDLRPRMYDISLGQKAVTSSDPLATFVPTSHVGVEIGGGVGLHYHYGTLGQLEHGANYAESWLKSVGIETVKQSKLASWPYPKGKTVKLYVLAGHRNMEGERAFVQQLDPSQSDLAKLNSQIAFKYSVGGGFRESASWEPLGPIDYYDSFGPELSFANKLQELSGEPFAIAKFTHSGSQIIDWTPSGSVAKSRNLYPDFIEFVKTSMAEIEQQGNKVELAAIVYHVGENDMSWGPFRKGSAERTKQLVDQSRVDLEMPELKWLVSLQSPTDDERVNSIDIVPEFISNAEADEHTRLIKVFDLAGQEKKLVISTQGIIELGQVLATSAAKLEK